MSPRVPPRLILVAAILTLTIAACGGGSSIEDAVSDEHQGADVDCERVAAKVLGEDVYSCALADVENAVGGRAVVGCYVYAGNDLREVSAELGEAVAAPGREGIDCGT
jgi:hypothetical protein